MRQKAFSSCYIIAAFVTSANAGLLFPEDLPTALNVAYSRIPSVRSGVDSRLGIGFRLGPNADIQLQWELGPQENTLPLMSSAKRDTANSATKSFNDNQINGYESEDKTRNDDDTDDEDDSRSVSTSPPSKRKPTTLSSRPSKLAKTSERDPDYGVKRLRKTLISLFANE